MNRRPRRLLPDEVVACAAARWVGGEPQQAIAHEMGLKQAFLSLEINRVLRTYLPTVTRSRRERFWLPVQAAQALAARAQQPPA